VKITDAGLTETSVFSSQTNVKRYRCVNRPYVGKICPKWVLTVVPLPFIIPASKDKKLAASTTSFCAIPNMMPGFSYPDVGALSFAGAGERVVLTRLLFSRV
jgi:hypothetical protein